MSVKRRVTRDFNPGGARWCDEHQRHECTKNRRQNRGPCHKLAVRGTNSCDLHSGYKRAVIKAQGEARISAWSPVGQAENPVSAPMAVLGMLQMSWLRVAAYSELLRQQVASEPAQAGDLEEQDRPTTSGLIGFRYGAAGKDGTIYAQTEETRALVALEASERDRVVKYAKTAHDMGISERLTQLAERWGDLVAEGVTQILAQLDLSPEQAAKVPALIHSHLTIDLEALGAADGKKDGKAA